VRLSFVLTAPWCCGITAAIGGIPFLWYAAALLIGLQGSFLFVAFGAKRRLTQMAWKKATGKPLRRRTTRASTREHRDRVAAGDQSKQGANAKTASASGASVAETGGEQQAQPNSSSQAEERV
jgi:hypothetical protein